MVSLLSRKFVTWPSELAQPFPEHHDNSLLSWRRFGEYAISARDDGQPLADLWHLGHCFGDRIIGEVIVNHFARKERLDQAQFVDVADERAHATTLYVSTVTAFLLIECGRANENPSAGRSRELHPQV